MKHLAAFIIASLMGIPSCYCLDAGETRISFTGDIIMHIPVKASALSHNKPGRGKNETLNNQGFDYLFTRIKDSFKDSDIVVGNMEFPVSPPFHSRDRVFNCYPEVLAALKDAGFTMVHIANNHILDQGVAGAINTITFLQNNGLDFIGVNSDEKTARKGVVKKVRGIRIGLIGYAGYLNFRRPRNPKGFFLNWFYDDDIVIADIADIRKKCDFLVMVVHAGVEYTYLPRAFDADRMKKYINRGVDLIIGHHPHFIQPAERVIADDGRVCFIFYSLGNFISNQDTRAAEYFNGVPLNTRDSIIVHCILERSCSGKRPSARFEVQPVHTVNRIDIDTRLRTIQTVSTYHEVQRLKNRLSNADLKEKVDIENQLQTLYQKTEAFRTALFNKREMKEITLQDNSGVYE
ncbi:MAG: hypothetical protein A2176_05595 [Spirochaetes bacterium RBG_13_51_14]|nr:MAG: hypothetical protein A2176_05595 [Spirochaetes bacterium RBG_13_51_14]